MSKLSDGLLHIFLPNRCMFCGEPIAYDGMLCAACAEQAPVTELSRCLLCGQEECGCTREGKGFDWLLAPFYYGMGSSRAIQDLKFHDNRLNARKLGYYMAGALAAGGKWEAFDLIFPAPLFAADLRRRGFNQAGELAKWVAFHTGRPMNAALLLKIRSTQKQHELDAAARRENLRGAFRVKEKAALNGRRVLLVDDVFTTGSTMRACARELYRVGAVEVGCLVAAKTQQNS